MTQCRHGITETTCGFCNGKVTERERASWQMQGPREGLTEEMVERSNRLRPRVAAVVLALSQQVADPIGRLVDLCEEFHDEGADAWTRHPTGTFERYNCRMTILRLLDGHSMKHYTMDVLQQAVTFQEELEGVGVR